MANLVPLNLSFLQILDKTQMGYFRFLYSLFLFKSFINKNFRNSRIGNDIDVKLQLGTKFDKKKTETSKKFGNSIMLKNCEVIIIFLIYIQCQAIWNLHFGRLVFNFYIFIYPTKTENRTEKPVTNI